MNRKSGIHESSLHSIGALLLASCCVGPAFAQGDQVLHAIGGFGGSQYNARCAQGEYLNGFELRAADDIDAIRPICAPATPNSAIARRPYPTSFGGPGGTIAQIVCPDSTPVVIAMFVLAEGETIVVSGIHLFCGLVAATNKMQAYPSAVFDAPDYTGHGFPTHFVDTEECPAGLVAVGISGRSGRWLDSVGLICGDPPLPGKVLVNIRQQERKPLVVPGPQVAATVGGSAAAQVSVNVPPVAPPSTPNLQQAAILYGIGSDGVLHWYRHNGAATGAGDRSPGAWADAQNVSRDWGAFKHVFTGGGGVIYAITQDGKLIWLRHAAYLTGQGIETSGAWNASHEVSNGWGNYRKVFSSGGGVIYAITQSGQLLWFRHRGFADGTPAWEGPKQVASGWGAYEQVFSGGNGIIYAVGANGVLRWNRHNGYQSGTEAWETPKDVGRGWNAMRQEFSVGNGIIYTIGQDGVLRWFKHAGYLDGRGLESPGAWSGGNEVGHGWNSFTNVFAQF